MMHPVKIHITYEDGSTKTADAFVDGVAFNNIDNFELANLELQRSIDEGHISGVVSMTMSMTPKQKYWFKKKMRKIVQESKPLFTALDYSQVNLGQRQNNDWRRKSKRFGGYQGG